MLPIGSFLSSLTLSLSQDVCPDTLVAKSTITLDSQLFDRRTLSNLQLNLALYWLIQSAWRLSFEFGLREVRPWYPFSMKWWRFADAVVYTGLDVSGIRMSAFHGNFFTRSTDLLSLPTVPTDQSYAIELQIEDPLTTPFIVLQTAVLHTTCFGERRIRVVTTALPTTTSLSEIYASADQNAIMTLLANKAVERAMAAKLEDARDTIMNKVVDILAVYKNSMTQAGGGASAQLSVPENLKLLPLLACGLVKHVSTLEF